MWRNSVAVHQTWSIQSVIFVEKIVKWTGGIRTGGRGMEKMEIRVDLMRELAGCVDPCVDRERLDGALASNCLQTVNSLSRVNKNNPKSSNSPCAYATLLSRERMQNRKT